MGLFDDVPTSTLTEPSERTTTPASVPPASVIPDGTDVITGKLSSRPAQEALGAPLAETWAQEKGYFCTDLAADVMALAAHGQQPCHVEGPKQGREHKLFVYAMTPDAAHALLNGGA